VSSAWNLLYVAHLVPRFLRWLLDHWKICACLLYLISFLFQTVAEMETEIPTQVLIRTLNKKPGLKDTNFQVLKARLEAVKLLAENAQFSRFVCHFVWCCSKNICGYYKLKNYGVF
jgi:hypothetical protein